MEETEAGPLVGGGGVEVEPELARDHGGALGGEMLVLMPMLEE